ncbi:hypothetical protein QYF61_016451 [Mycteria americana]|uniref:Maestro/Maestro-like HEAT-repeats domain-containing protein n=1 Tax=Mycteria americana TaxID=33587 RepID=A0AAN7MK48_MYCAM|nr:hypothetical protein QYF61_016451 [Mycteria americana]
MAVLLPDIMETLQDANTDVKMKALVFLGNMMAHMKREEASLIALQLAEKLLPLFDDGSGAVQPQLQIWPTAPVFRMRPQSISPPISHANSVAHRGREWLLLKSPCPPPYQESSQVREVSISLFKDVMKTVRERSKKKMKKTVQRVLLPLFIRMNDQIKSVAKVQ